MKILFATANKGKLREAAEVLGPEYEVVSPAEIGITEDIPETGATLQENSLQKARYLYERAGLPCFADDTGLEVEALGGAPGIHTARYAGPGHDSGKNMDKLLKELERLEPGSSNRRAQFRTVVTLILADGQPHFFEGVCKGSIAREKHGDGGFGYDPVFLPDAYPGRAFAEVSDEDKNAVSHRGQAIRAMAAWLHSH
ncbi:MAG: RdgB/HAM1 family non-canonical purine NTP pyrophosphatase [Bacteroidales bacterium]|nr:RdgB/HAM1 family non-canonical purine NTP pyrophosphatase [Bacteroidales bacterium]